MTLPTIHMNGTSRGALSDALREAASKLRDARAAIQETSPNGRDYYLQGPNAIRAATIEHVERLRKLDAVYDEIYALYEAVENAGSSR